MSGITYIGIDPGVNTGFAVYESKSKKILELYTTDFWGCTGAINTLFERLGYGMVVVIEDPNLNKSIHWNQIPDIKKLGINGQCKFAQNVGMNKKEADLIIKYLKLKGIPHKAIKPTASKKDAIYVKRVTGYKGSTNEHTRDAIMLVFGR